MKMDDKLSASEGSAFCKPPLGALLTDPHYRIALDIVHPHMANPGSTHGPDESNSLTTSWL